MKQGIIFILLLVIIGCHTIPKSENVKTVALETDIFVVADLFLKNHFRRVPVLNGKKLVGQISRCDVLSAVQDIVNVKENTTPQKEYLSEEMKSSLK